MAAKRTDKASRLKSEESRHKVVATNRQARRDYEILDTVEAGIVLRGSEVKALREAKVQLADAYGKVSGPRGVAPRPAHRRLLPCRPLRQPCP